MSMQKTILIKKGQDVQPPSVDVKRSFEKNFQALVSAVVKEQFPDLDKYSLGFQLIYKSPNNDKAIGIYVVRLRTLGFIPFVFDEGKLKGYEVIYLPKYDLFLPTTELWLSILKQKDSDIFDKVVDEDYESLATSSFPNLVPLRRPVSFSPGGAVKLSAKIKVASTILKHPGMCVSLVKSFDAYPFLVKKALVRFGKKFLDAVIKKAAAFTESFHKKADYEQDSEIEVYTETAAKDIGILPSYIVDRIQKFGYCIIDRRKNARKEVVAALNNFSAFPIYKPGKYSVVVSDDLKLKDGTVLRLFKLEDTGEDWLFIPDDDDDAVYLYQSKDSCNSRTVTTSPSAFKVLASKTIKPPRARKVTQEIVDRFNSNSEKAIAYLGVEEGEDATTVVFLDQEGNAVAVCIPDSDVSITLGKVDKITARTIKHKGPLHSRRHVLIALPKDSYYLVLSRDKIRRWVPFSPLAVHDLLEKDGHLRVKVSHCRNSDRFYIDNQEFNRLGALVYLMKHYGLAQAPAEKVLKEACRHETHTFWIKRADFPEIENKEHPQAWFPGDYPTGYFAPGYLAKSKIEVDYIVPGLKKPKPVVNIMEPPPEEVIQTLQKIDEVNNGEVFDVALFMALLKTTRDENLIDFYLPRLILALDALGRVLFNLVVHREAMIERYDKLDYEKIVDNVKSNIESLGDLVVDLTQKDVIGYFEEAAETKGESE